MRGGNIRGSLSVPFVLVLAEDGTFKTKEDLTQTFQAQGVDLDKRIVGTCGSGVTASVLQLALEVIGQGAVEGQEGVTARRVYDGSWSEYGSTPEMTDEEIQALPDRKSVV